MKVLEIGAGPALYSRLIAECYSPSFVVALDLVPVQFSVYRNEIKKAEISLVGGDCFTLPFPDGSFNIVFGSLILHRFRELNKVLDELYRVLKKNGSYMGIEPAVRNPLHVCRHFFSGHSPNEYFLTIGMFRRAFEKSGFVPLVFGISPKYPFLTNFGMFSCSGIRARKD
jgi:ubiquinone/menaquinone biosynthesis C-methylase UbiE